MKERVEKALTMVAVVDNDAHYGGRGEYPLKAVPNATAEEMQAIIKELYAENQALKADKKELVDIICHIKEVAGKDMDYGSNSEAVRQCYCISVNVLLTEAALQSKGEWDESTICKLSCQ